ncbi:pollen-specific leucine-rich repeat extensin-like protein 2 [Pecten maximus]|uniref:pollen-specific leucine-rich repeat extensin-like protein 2 n=1 Tax=Pecten maximus TaxID=6579 RepID=UPI00145880AE|nr:pollen-specific leucine-rich repeat extensin-like protein 2 [Pecten maximus]
MSPQVVGLLFVTFVTLLKTTNGQVPMHTNFFGQGGMLDHECYERPYQTSCVGPIPRYFYNATDKRCEQINNVCGYGGFFSLQECDNKCTCRIPPEAGTNTCPGAVESQRYFFQQSGDLCLPFTYYGCEGNGNNFATSLECTMQCNPLREIEQGDVMRKLGFTNERAFEMQAGLFNYGAPPPPPPPRPKANPAPLPPHPPPNPSHQHHPPGPPPRRPPPPPAAGHFTPTSSSWNSHPTPTYRPRWQPPPPPPNQRPSYMPHMRSPRPPPPPPPPNQQALFGNHPMKRQMIHPPPPNNRRNGGQNPVTHSTAKSTFSMSNVKDKLKQFAKNVINRQTPRKNGGGMNWNPPNRGQMRSNGQATIPPTPTMSIAPSTMMPMGNNWRGRANPRQRKQGTAESNKIAVKPTPSDQGITSGSLNQPKMKMAKSTTTQASVGFNGGTTDYYYYDNNGYTTAGYYNNVQSGWRNTGRGMGK